MKIYSEEVMKNLRLGFEEIVLRWPRVSTKKLFGCPSYQAKDQLFTFLVTHGTLITQVRAALIGNPADQIDRIHLRIWPLDPLERSCRAGKRKGILSRGACLRACR